MYIFFGGSLFVAAVLNTLLLSFAYRDFSWGLMGMTILSVIGIPLATYIITTYYNPRPSVMLITEDKETGKKTAWYQYLEEEENHINGFFNDCR